MRRMIAALVSAGLLLAGCSNVPGSDPSAGSIANITVEAGESGTPTLDYDRSLNYTKAQTRVEWKGSGEVLKDGDPLLLDIYAISLDRGNVLLDTYSDLPNAYLLAPELVGEDLYEALLGERVGTRILHVSPPGSSLDEDGAIAMVIDVLPDRANGRPQAVRDDLPLVILGPTGEPVVTFRDEEVAPLPGDLTAHTLIQGDGEQIRSGSRVMLNYVEVSATTHEVLSSTWARQDAPWKTQVGGGTLPTGLDQALIDVAEGSQVLVIVPPILAYGDDTLVFVVDVLAVRAPE